MNEAPAPFNGTPESIRLTQFSHGAGCGCKIAPDQLDRILAGSGTSSVFDRLLVGHAQKDDAAVYETEDGCLISTTDFFTPIVDDAFDFGEIASVNALSDVYAMGGRPLMAIAILGWPIDKLPVELAGAVVKGARSACERAGIPLAGGHSIDLAEPIFGLAVSGWVEKSRLKTNGGAKEGDVLFLSKPLGVGLLSTAQKRGLAHEADLHEGWASMKKLNTLGAELSEWAEVHALTDVTGFGLGGHLLEVCNSSGLDAELDWSALPRFDWAQGYFDQGCAPGGTQRNLRSYGTQIGFEGVWERHLLADPQTSGGLLFSVAPKAVHAMVTLLQSHDCPALPIGRMRKPKNPGSPRIEPLG
ncbi:selenide, water dikinase SelD [bacterium]|nr:selenide, water dikinase SelD [bacterium]